MKRFRHKYKRLRLFSLGVVVVTSTFIFVEVSRRYSAIRTVRRAGGVVQFSQWMHTEDGIENVSQHSYLLGLPIAISVSFSNELTDSNISSLAYFSKKERLSLIHCQVSADDWESRVQGGSLTELTIERCEFDRKESIDFSHFSRLKRLIIDDLEDVDVHLAELDRASSLERIEFRNVDVGLSTIQCINKLSKLEHLKFDNARLSDIELRSMIAPQLETLEIVYSDVNSDTVQSLTFQNLRKLILREWAPTGNQIVFPSALDIDLSYSNLSNMDAIMFPGQLQSLRLDGCVIRKPILDALTKCENLWDLFMNDCMEVDIENVIESLRKCKELGLLELEGVIIDDSTAHKIASQFPLLISLTVSTPDKKNSSKKYLFQ